MSYNPSGEEMQKDPIGDNLSSRDSERLIGHFKASTKYKINFLKFPTDFGVIRNGGRRGASYAPQVLINSFKKMAAHPPFSQFNEINISNANLEIENFNESQKLEAETIFKTMNSIKSDFQIYLGGGHDHIYPILKAIEKIYTDKKIVIINLDPHLDTRADSIFHSGTPFRQFDEEANRKFELYQIGTHSHANVESSLRPLKNCHHKIISFNEVRLLTENFTHYETFFQTHFKFDPNAIYFLSLDADAIESSTMEAVSAPNHLGLPCAFIEYCFSYFKENLNCREYGFFEYNPLYENLSLKGARYLTQLIYNFTK